MDSMQTFVVQDTEEGQHIDCRHLIVTHFKLSIINYDYEELYILSKALTGPTHVWADAITSGGHKGRMCQKLTATNSFMAARTKLLSSEEDRRIHEERVQMYRREDLDV